MQNGGNSSRELKDINEVLNFAKLSENDILPTSQALFFTSENIKKSDYRLLELNDDLLRALDQKETLSIKGEDEDEVVICSKSITFHVTEAETSNSLLLVKPMKFSNDIQNTVERNVQEIEVFRIFQEYLEAIVGRPNFKQLYELLNDSVYKGPEHEFEVENKKKYTLAELKNVVQASDQELVEAIKSMDIVEIDGKLRLLHFEYHFRSLSYMLKLIEENSWELDGIDYDETCDALRDLVPVEIVKSLFEKYTHESRIIDGLQLYRYDEAKVCRFFARVLLRETGKFNLEEFLQAWKESVPEGMIPNEEMLYGIAIINRKSCPNVIWALEESTLPDNINERFKILFQEKDKWTVAEITPYVRPLTTNKLDVNALLAKYARASKVNGIKYYSAKHDR